MRKIKNATGIFVLNLALKFLTYESYFFIWTKEIFFEQNINRYKRDLNNKK